MKPGREERELVKFRAPKLFFWHYLWHHRRGHGMRLIRLIPAAVALFMSAPALAQGWIEYTNREDRFSVNFPGQPSVRDFTYTSSLDAPLPARIYTAERGAERYSVTFVDYTRAERIHTERAKNCPPGAQSLCFGGDEAAQGTGGWKYDVLGAVDFATWQLLKRDAKVTYFSWATIDRIVGRQIHFTNPDQSRTFVQIHMYENRLYIFEATVPPRAPEPGLFQQSPRFLDADGRPARYEGNYMNMYPPPPRAGQGRQGGAGPQGDVGREGVAGR
jgi:hypothetical protein